MIDQSLIPYLTEEERDRMRRLESMFDHPGWKLVEKWAKMNSEEAVQIGAVANSWEENRIMLGKRMIFDIIHNLRDINAAEYTQKALERAEEAKANKPEKMNLDGADSDAVIEESGIDLE